MEYTDCPLATAFMLDTREASDLGVLEQQLDCFFWGQAREILIEIKIQLARHMQVDALHFLGASATAPCMVAGGRENGGVVTMAATCRRIRLVHGTLLGREYDLADAHAVRAGV